MDRICIAMISDFFHPAVGGVENHIYMLSVKLVERGHKVIVITHSHPPDRVGVRHLHPSLKVYHIPFPTIASNASLPNYFAFLPYFRTIVLREHVQLVHGHGSLSSLAHEGILHSWMMGIRTVFTDHSLFGFDDAASILTNKLLRGALRNVDAVICVSHTGRENTVLRGHLFKTNSSPPTVDDNVYVIPNALVPDHFTPSAIPPDTDGKVTVVVISRLAYRKGVDLLVAVAPTICALFPNVQFLVGGDGPKLIELLQMREKHMLEDRIILLGPVKPRDVRSVLVRGSIFLNTSLTESFGIAILEAACTGLYVVSTRVGGVPEVLPDNMIEFAESNKDDVIRALSKAIRHISSHGHDRNLAHEMVKGYYDWENVTERTEQVYERVICSEERTFGERVQRTLQLGPFAGIIYTTILIVDCIFFLILEWCIPREDLDYTPMHNSAQ